MLSERDTLYNALLNAVKENAKGYERGLVIAVLAELSSAISGYSSREPVDILLDKLQERQPYKRHTTEPTPQSQPQSLDVVPDQTATIHYHKNQQDARAETDRRVRPTEQPNG